MLDEHSTYFHKHREICMPLRTLFMHSEYTYLYTFIFIIKFNFYGTSNDLIYTMYYFPQILTSFV